MVEDLTGLRLLVALGRMWATSALTNDLLGFRAMSGGIDGETVPSHRRPVPTHLPTPTKLLTMALVAEEAAGRGRRPRQALASALMSVDASTTKRRCGPACPPAHANPWHAGVGRQRGCRRCARALAAVADSDGPALAWKTVIAAMLSPLKSCTTEVCRNSTRRIPRSAGFLGLAGGLVPSRCCRASPGPGRPKRLVVVRAGGEWDVTFCMDRVAAGWTVVDDHRRSHRQLRRPSSWPTRWSAPTWMRSSATPARAIVINGVSVGSIVHEECRLRIAAGSEHLCRHGHLSAVAHGSSETLPYLDLTGGGRVGYAAIAGLRRTTRSWACSTASLSSRGWLRLPRYTPQGGQRTTLDEYLDVRQGRFADRLGTQAATARVNTLGAAMDRQRALMDSTLYGAVVWPGRVAVESVRAGGHIDGQ